MTFSPRFSITNPIATALTRIERARGFLEAAKLSEDWIRRMGEWAFVLEAHHTTHIEGTRLTLEQSERLLAGEAVPEADADDARELLNYRDAFELVSGYLGEGGPVTESFVREIDRRLVERALLRTEGSTNRAQYVAGKALNSPLKIPRSLRSPPPFPKGANRERPSPPLKKGVAATCPPKPVHHSLRRRWKPWRRWKRRGDLLDLVANPSLFQRAVK